MRSQQRCPTSQITQKDDGNTEIYPRINIEVTLTDNDEFSGHEIPQDLKDNLENGPFLGLHEPPAARGQHQGVPGSDGECAYEKVLVCAEMRREIEVGGQ